MSCVCVYPFHFFPTHTFSLYLWVSFFLFIVDDVTRRRAITRAGGRCGGGGVLYLDFVVVDREEQRRVVGEINGGRRKRGGKCLPWTFACHGNFGRGSSHQVHYCTWFFFFFLLYLWSKEPPYHMMLDLDPSLLFAWY